MIDCVLGPVVYQNALAREADVAGFRLEGKARITFPEGRMRMQNALDPALGQRSNFVCWCPVELPPDIVVTWDFWPLQEPGLCILFFAARGRGGQSIFAPDLAPRSGEYHQYHHGDINALHVSYFRRRAPEERAFNVCNLRKSYGFHLVAQGADPIPTVADARPPYHLRLGKVGAVIEFAVNDLTVLHWEDDGVTYGPRLDGGVLGFRQMAPLVAEYANLVVRSAQPG